MKDYRKVDHFKKGVNKLEALDNKEIDQKSIEDWASVEFGPTEVELNLEIPDKTWFTLAIWQ